MGATCLALGLIGCNSGDRDVSSKELPPPQEQTPAPSAPVAPGAEVPLDANVPQPPKVKQVADAQPAYNSAKKAFNAKKDADSKVAYIQATMDLADAYMWGNADQKIKYRNALQYYREALKADPKNAKAKASADIIVAIYKQMGRPVPGGDG